ncbi:MAG: hypothetical protein ACREJO_14075 [Phycisphaerales bacterium]
MEFWRAQHPRLRRFCKWLGIVLIAVVVLVDLASLIWRFSVQSYMFQSPTTSGTTYASISAGQIYFLHRGDWGGDVQCWFAYATNSHKWWVRFGSTNAMSGGKAFAFAIPFWSIVLLIAVPTAWLWRLDRPSRRALLARSCDGCGYDLTGLAGGQQCPECGLARALK